MKEDINNEMIPSPELGSEEFKEIPAQLEGMSKIAAATTVAQTLSFSTERKSIATNRVRRTVTRARIQSTQ